MNSQLMPRVGVAAPVRRVGVGMSSGALQNLQVGLVTVEVAAAGAVLGAVVGLLAKKGSGKAAGVGGLIGAVVGGALGGFTGYELKQGATS